MRLNSIRFVISGEWKIARSSRFQRNWRKNLNFIIIFFLLTGTLPFYFIISFSILYLCVNLGHRSPRVMSWRTCAVWTVCMVGGSYFSMPPLLLPGLEPASPRTLTVLTRVRCLSLKPDMDREVRSHPDSRIITKVQSWELGLSRVLRPDDHRSHPELRHVSSLHCRLRHQSCLLYPGFLKSSLVKKIN